MDGLVKLSQAYFDSAYGFRVSQAPIEHATLEISISATDPKGTTHQTTVLVSTVSESDLASWATADGGSDSTPCEARLKLIRIDQIHDEIPNISKAAFRSLTNAMGVHPAALYMVCRKYDGFHTYKGPGSSHTWFFGSSTHAILWCYSPSRRQTVGVFMERIQANFQDFCRVLSAFSENIHAPQVLFLSSAIHQQHNFDVGTASELGVIQRIEQQTGFGPSAVKGYALIKSEPTAKMVRAEIDELTVWSQAVGEIGVNCSNRGRNHRTFWRMLAALRQDQEDSETLGLPQGPAMERYKASLRELCDVLPTVERQLETYDEYILYLKDRTERLSSVLFTLLTHVDARAGIGLASAAKRDSSSMKTVAIMTMAFLPATFFAALFAMPLLEWDGSHMVQKGFWVYLACTIPVTLLVFALWLGIIERRWILGGTGSPKGFKHE
ncbi:unnamed protein product [Clonostachys byssicola]|uniref:Uncharacterized protein n=1 Tax=Clonostachys byssicola TaxID=160290 RepID=A0A9N9Y312_9HYPO|nr:unnamed protein product [Clonostachys byssicola]